MDFRAALGKDLSPAQQRQWLNAFEQSAPNNSLANYLSAVNFFSSGQNDQAVQELNDAAAKSQYQDYTLDSIQNMEEAYLAAGYSEADAGMIAEATTQLPQIAVLKQLGQNMVSLAILINNQVIQLLRNPTPNEPELILLFSAVLPACKSRGLPAM